MGLKRIIARNVIWNMAGMVVGMLAGFVVAPFLVYRLGQTSYGLWILIGSLTGYFGLLDLGVRGSVGRYIAYHRARDEQQLANINLNTALAILCGVALVTLAGIVVIYQIFFHIFDVPAEHMASARLALILVGINLAISFPLNLFDATLWAMQRFDLLNVIDIPITLLRVGLTFWLVGAENGLVVLAVITLVTTLLAGLSKASLSFYLDRGLRLSPALVNFSIGRKIYGYGVWHFLLELAVMLSSHMCVLIIGVWATMELVTSYSVASRLITTATALLIACTGVLTPVATAFEAEQNVSQQRRLFLRGGQCCTLFALYFLGLFLFLGETIITLWMGQELAGASRWLTILAIGQVLPMSQWVTHSMVLAMGRHRFTACVGLIECLAATILGVLLVRPYGVAGICIAFVACAVLSRGLIQMLYGCRLVHVSPLTYVSQVWLRPLLAAALPLACLALHNQWSTTVSWLSLIAWTSLFTLLYGSMALVILLPRPTWPNSGLFSGSTFKALSPRTWLMAAPEHAAAPELQGVHRP